MAKIVVIDDDQSTVDLLSMRLTEAGHDVVGATDGFSGAMISAREKPDIIILDFNMPAANGAKVHERLRGNTFTTVTPIIFLTAMPIGEILGQVKDDDLTRFLQKPVDFALLFKTLVFFLGAAPPSAPVARPSAPAAPPAERYDPDDPNSSGGGETINLD